MTHARHRRGPAHVVGAWVPTSPPVSQRRCGPYNSGDAHRSDASPTEAARHLPRVTHPPLQGMMRS
ncbi:hypothetical protein ACFPM0_31310 [Pseudonocardia sulfidoxydans]|uniref:hypothetical protein n=1 Tax=Pseudonocardia sulfidoxydans TaxID=54011 RepID=UPI00361AA71C